MVPEVGIEPTWDCSRWILSPVRLPVSPLRHIWNGQESNTVTAAKLSRKMAPSGCFNKDIAQLVCVISGRPDAQDDGKIDQY